jgi:hypothetical protein
MIVPFAAQTRRELAGNESVDDLHAFEVPL